MATVKRLCLSPAMPLSSWRPAPSRPWMPSVTVPWVPSTPHFAHTLAGWVGGGRPWAGRVGRRPWEAARLNRVSRSPALLPGIPVVRGLRRVLGRRVPLHRGLLLCPGPGKGDQHRCVLVSAHRCLLHVSFQLWVGRREACGTLTEASCLPYIGSWLWTAVTQTSPQLGGGKQSLLSPGPGSAGASSLLPGVRLLAGWARFPRCSRRKAARKMGCCRPQACTPHPCPPFQSKQVTRPAQRRGLRGRCLLCIISLLSCAGNRVNL